MSKIHDTHLEMWSKALKHCQWKMLILALYCWWGSLDSTPRNFDFTIFLTLNNYAQRRISQEQQPFPRKAVCSLKIDSTKTTNQIRQLCLVAHVDQVLSAIWMILKILTQCSQFFWQSGNLSLNILQHDAIRWVQLSGQLIILILWQSPYLIPYPGVCQTHVWQLSIIYCAGIPVHSFSCLSEGYMLFGSLAVLAQQSQKTNNWMV